MNNVNCKILKQKNKDQLLLDGHRYRCANKSQIIWRCCINNCAGRVRFIGIEYVKVTDHVHAPNPEEIISMELLILVQQHHMINVDELSMKLYDI